MAYWTVPSIPDYNAGWNLRYYDIPRDKLFQQLQLIFQGKILIAVPMLSYRLLF